MPCIWIPIPNTPSAWAVSGAASIMEGVANRISAAVGDRIRMLNWPAVTASHLTGDAIHIVEMFAPAVDKWEMAVRYCERHDLDATRIVAIGDGLNDIGMLRSAALGIAMGNAASDIKSVADWTTASNADDGFAKAIDRLLEGARPHDAIAEHARPPTGPSQGYATLSGAEAIVKGVLECFPNVHVLSLVETPSQLPLIKLLREPAIIDLLRMHRLRVLVSRSAARAMEEAMWAARDSNHVVAVLGGPAACDTLAQILTQPPRLVSDSALGCIVENTADPDGSRTPASMCIQSTLPTINASDVEHLRDSVEHGLRLSRADGVPTITLAHPSIFSSGDTLQLRPNRSSADEASDAPRRSSTRVGPNRGTPNGPPPRTQYTPGTAQPRRPVTRRIHHRGASRPRFATDHRCLRTGRTGARTAPRLGPAHRSGRDRSDTDPLPTCCGARTRTRTDRSRGTARIERLREDDVQRAVLYGRAASGHRWPTADSTQRPR